ncbi:hypothetical protein LKL35_30175 [Streptomyces sp. ET3-23]|uniref:hypothetical protein n=1 Tax=Streptomyces sp. ET3-23 TaxID=2885643 RepID=UPI001D10C5AC|nr:hypothetical protein [Streptomyces sp. ET3-23]MCC2279664.1 hypothetical protein [Streptomyces sp. ET3-23]
MESTQENAKTGACEAVLGERGEPMDAPAARWLLSREPHPYPVREAWMRDTAAVLRTGLHFDAVLLPGHVVHRLSGSAERRAVERVFRVAGIGGAVIVDRPHRGYTVLVAPGTSTTWSVPGIDCLGAAHPLGYVRIPAPHRAEPPGAYWLLTPPDAGEGLCDPGALRRLIGAEK